MMNYERLTWVQLLISHSYMYPSIPRQKEYFFIKMNVLATLKTSDYFIYNNIDL